MAFIARYGKTHPDVTRYWPMSDVRHFAEALNQILDEEAEAMRSNRDTD